MKDKEKQISKNKEINDLANTLYNRQDKYDLSNPFEVAKCVIDLGYRKIPEDSIVLSKAKYEMLIACSSYEGIMGKLKDEYIRGSKETAEKFLQLAYDRCLEKSFIKKVEELAKQFGVEIKE